MMKIRFSILLSILSWSFVTGQISVTGSFDRDSVVIGQEVNFTLSVEADNNIEILAVPHVFLDSIYSALQTYKVNPSDTSGMTPPQIADFELISTGEWTDNNDDQIYAQDELVWTTSSVANRTLYEHSFTLKFWDPGPNLILLPPVIYRDATGAQQEYYEGGQVQVIITAPAGISDMNPDSLEVAPIKPILTEAKNLSDYYMYFILIGAALLFALLYWLSKKIKERPTETVELTTEPKVYIPAHQKALTALSALRNKQLWQKGEIKEYQSELTFIIRDYLEDRYKVPALESTTDEIMHNLKHSKLDLSDINSLKRILQVADLVKFAKATPEESVHESFMNEAESFVNRTKEQEIESDE